MKFIHNLLMLAIILVLASCGQKSHDHEHADDHSHDSETGPNQALYDGVMKIHDEVMPKLNDIYKVKEELKKKIADTPNMAEEKKKEIEATIAKLDSASEGMMIWMRQFDPIPDSLGEEKAREYLEDQMEKVKGVKEDILEALEKANSTN